MNKLLVVPFALMTIMSAETSANWEIIGLGTLGGNSSDAHDINDFGQIVGQSDIFGNSATHPFMTDANGQNMIDIGTLGGLNAVANSINNSGYVAGASQTSGNIVTHGFTYNSTAGAINDLGEFSSIPTGSGAMSINDSGQVVGGSYTSNGLYTSFVYNPDDQVMTNLGGFGGHFSLATDINNKGQVSGYSSFDKSGGFHAYIANAASLEMNYIGTAGDYRYSFANAINDNGQVIGLSYSYSLNSDSIYYRSFITDENGENIRDLGTLGGLDSNPTDINNLGYVVGTSMIDGSAGTSHAFLYANGGMIDINILDSVISAGWKEILPRAINNNNQIVGIGRLDGDDHYQAFLLSFDLNDIQNTNPVYIPPIPNDISLVPEPSTYAMLIAGVGIIGACTRKINAI